MGILVSDLQDISRIEAGQLQLEFNAISLEKIVTEVVTTMETQIDQKSQQLTLEVPDDLPLIWCDDTRMVQVFTNLVSNANKYTQVGGQISICAELIEDLSMTQEESNVIKILIADNGFGISEADQEQIFEQFFRSDDSRVRESTGTGLGLSISKRLVELQGGKLWFESEIGKGTTFFLTLPIAEQA
jgi:signal transduction histidine kinase